MSPGIGQGGARRRAVVTGGAGFIGSHVVDRLTEEAWAVLVVDDLSTGRAANVHVGATLEQLDLGREDPAKLFRRWRPHVVFHLAAQSSVPASFVDPLRDLAVNVIGTHRVASAAIQARAHALVFVSSGGAIYGETRRPATERSRPAPASYYGAHKLAAESHVALSGVPYAIARLSNVYGPRQTGGLEGAVVAAFVDQARAGNLRIHGDGQQTRDLTHVADVVEALLLLGGDDGPRGIWNVSGGTSVSVASLADLVERAAGRQLERVHSPRRPGDVRHSAISSAALRARGWSSRVALADGIAALMAAATASSGTDPS